MLANPGAGAACIFNKLMHGRYAKVSIFAPLNPEQTKRFFEPGVQDVLALLRSVPGCFLILLPDSPRFTIAGATDAYLQATFTQREAIVGKPLFDVFTDDPSKLSHPAPPWPRRI